MSSSVNSLAKFSPALDFPRVAAKGVGSTSTEENESDGGAPGYEKHAAKKEKPVDEDLDVADVVSFEKENKPFSYQVGLSILPAQSFLAMRQTSKINLKKSL